MAPLLLVLWASLVSMELTGGMMVNEVPGKDWAGVEGDGAGVVWGCWPVLPNHLCVFLFIAQNLSCFECFKVLQASKCHPIECRPNEKVCVSNEVLLYTSESVL
jgi:hypothetical protein